LAIALQAGVIDVEIPLKVHTGASSLHLVGDAPDELACVADQGKALLRWSPDVDDEAVAAWQKVRLAGTSVDKAAI
jgi:hypothetical protein